MLTPFGSLVKLMTPYFTLSKSFALLYFLLGIGENKSIVGHACHMHSQGLLSAFEVLVLVVNL